ncbi:MAG: hypothetical protein HFH38_05235 [Lachnospiraceae bacterium]|jgi:hypothetical protein|nr:hypothetical protein [Lachnospiraceae bacterium]
MKDEYILYLDESEFKNTKTFAIAGIAMKKENISLLEQGMEEVKKLIGLRNTLLLIIQSFIAQNCRNCSQIESLMILRMLKMSIKNL